MNNEVETTFESYVERYCRTRHITPEEAKKHLLVQEVRKYYENKKGGLSCEP